MRHIGKKDPTRREKTRTFPHNADKTTEPSGSLYKYDPSNRIFPPKQRGVWINYRLKIGIISNIAWFFRYFRRFFHIPPHFCGKRPTLPAMRLAMRGAMRILSEHCIHDDHQNRQNNVLYGRFFVQRCSSAPCARKMCPLPLPQHHFIYSRFIRLQVPS